MQVSKTILIKLLNIIILSSVVVSLSCSEKSELERLRQYYGSINAAEGEVNVAGATPLIQTLAPLGTGGAASTVGATIVQGTPRVAKDGVCGDGVINGTTEDCDQGAIQNTSCRDYGAISGEVRCQPNCLYDISECITPIVDRRIGGQAENCRCRCDASPCSGGCRNTAVAGQGACQYDCDNQCVCACEGKLNAIVEDCRINCVCSTDVNSNPDCECTLSQCDLLVTISPNIATIVSTVGVP